MSGALCAAGIFLFAQGATAAVLRVHPGGSDAGGGATWPTAKRTVTAALATARAGDEIWVAAGVYAERIDLRNEVALYGGFAGIETARDARDWLANPSILDGGGAGIVVRCQFAGATPATRLDGFTIRNGVGILGGGIACTATSPTLANNLITGNVSHGPGGGICCDNGANPVIVNNRIVDNLAGGEEADGGGIACITGGRGNLGSSPLILGNLIARNRAEENGGGIVASGIFVSEDGQVVVPSAPVILNNLIADNLATQPPLGDRSLGGGGIACVDDGMAPRIANNTIVGNSGLQAGGILLVGGARDQPLVANNTLVGNGGPAIRWVGVQSLRFVNNLVAFNTAGLTRWSQQPGGTPTLVRNLIFGNEVDFDGLPDVRGVDGNLGLDPRLAGAAYGDLHLQPDSPCIHAGDPTWVDAGWVDMDGTSRLQDGRVDIGADEADGLRRTVQPRILRVSPTGNDARDGATWGTAKRTIGAAILTLAERKLGFDHVLSGGEVWVQSGTYTETLVLPPHVYLYGGFRGIETARATRDPRANTTRIDGGGRGRVILAVGGHALNAVDGFTLTGGRQTATPTDQGGGIECYQSGTLVANNLLLGNIANLGAGLGAYGASPSVRDCVFSNNIAGGDGQGLGGGIHLDRSFVTIRDSVFTANAASDGGGIYGSFSQPRIVNCEVFLNEGKGISLQNTAGLPWSTAGRLLIADSRIYRNQTSHEGGGVYLLFCAGRVVNNLVALNRSGTLNGGGTGGGLSLNGGGEADGDLLVANNTIVGNVAEYFGLNFGGGVNVFLLQRPNVILANNVVAYNSSGIFNQRVSPVSPVMVRNLFFANNGADYQLTGAFGLPGGPLTHPTDISGDPRFVSTEGDFRLQSTSPAIDTADPLYAPPTDGDGRPRPLAGAPGATARADLGAYEFHLARVPGRLELDAAVQTAFAGEGAVRLMVRRGDGLGGAVSVAFATRDGTARAGTDYTAATGRLNFAEGQSEATITVAVDPSGPARVPKTFTFGLSDPGGGAALGNVVETQVTLYPASVYAVVNPWNIPEDWIVQHGLLLTATSDADGDGLLDRFEYAAGTNPRDPGSVLRVLGVWTSPDDFSVTLRWSTRPGKRYAIRRWAVLPGPTAPVGVVVKTGLVAAGAELSWSDTPPYGKSWFYRVEVEP